MTSHFSHAHTILMSTVAATSPDNKRQTEDMKKKQKLGETLLLTMDESRKHTPHHQQSHYQRATFNGNEVVSNQYMDQRNRWERDLGEVILAQEIPLVSALRDISETSYGAMINNINFATNHQQQQEYTHEQCRPQHSDQRQTATIDSSTESDTGNIETALQVHNSLTTNIGSEIKVISSLIATDFLIHSLRTGLPWTLAKRRLLQKRREVRLHLIRKQHMLMNRRRMRQFQQLKRKRYLIANKPSITSSSLTGRVRGLPNHGQTCFLNSVLQALASLTPFVAYLERIVHLYCEIDYATIMDENAASTILENEVLGEEVVVVDNGLKVEGDLEWNDAGSNLEVESDLELEAAEDSGLTLDQEKELQQRQDMRVTPLLLQALQYINDVKSSISSLTSTTKSASLLSLSQHQVDPKQILNRVAQKHAQFRRRRGPVMSASTNEQQDAQEFLQALMSVVISESYLVHGGAGFENKEGASGDESKKNGANVDVGNQFTDESGSPQQHTLGGVITPSAMHAPSLLDPSFLFTEEDEMMHNRQDRSDNNHSSPSFTPLSPFSPILPPPNPDVPLNGHDNQKIVTQNVQHRQNGSNGDTDNVLIIDKKPLNAIELSQSITLSDGFCMEDDWESGVILGNGDSSSTISFTHVQQNNHCDHKEENSDSNCHIKQNDVDEVANNYSKNDCDEDSHPEVEIVTLSSMLTKVGKVQTRFKEEEDYSNGKFGCVSRSSCSSSFSSDVKISDKEQYRNGQLQHLEYYGDKNGYTSHHNGNVKTSSHDIGNNQAIIDDSMSQEQGILILDGSSITPHDAATATTTSTTTSIEAITPSPSPSPSPSPPLIPDTTSPTSKAMTSQLSASMQIMIKTLSSITPSPLNGWFGSTLQCCSCNHISPIQNAPFLDIPIVPTSLSHFQKSSMRRMSSSSPSHYRSTSSPLSSLPACSLDDCLSDFTAVEKVQGVDCHACAINAELKKLEEEGSMLRGAIENINSRRMSAHRQKQGKNDRNDQRNGNSEDGIIDVDSNTVNGHDRKGASEDEPTQALRRDLDKINDRINFLQGVDPDDGDNIIERNEGWNCSNQHDDDLLLHYCCPTSFTTDDEEKKCDNINNVGQGTEQRSISYGESMPTISSRLPKAHRGDANKRLLLTRLPPILCLHAKRLFYDPSTDRIAKAMQHIIFPEFLDLSKHCAYSGDGHGVVERKCSSAGIGFGDSNTIDQKPIMYRLMSVIEHRGNAYAGHYLTYRRIVEQSKHDTKNSVSSDSNGHHPSSTNEWIMASDEKTSFVNWEEVSQCQAYMLFYEAI